VAEGDTGGVLLEWLTSVPGSSRVVLGGVVAYHDSLKEQLLGVSTELFRQHGSVSRAVAEAMARGVRQVTGASLGVATTGIAGPGGATETKPVGLAWLAVDDEQGHSVAEHVWQGDRASNRASSAQAALALSLQHLNSRQPRTDVLT
jgi:PncC family amidohydrolase